MTLPCNANIVGVGDSPTTPIHCHGHAGHPGPHHHATLGEWTDDYNGTQPHDDTRREN